MDLKFEPSTPIGTVVAPPSKSYAHRQIIALCLSKGNFTLSNVALSKDVSATLDCIKMLDKDYAFENGKLTFFDKKYPRELTVNCGESGSTLRFFIPLAIVSGKKVTLTGTEKLFSRGIDIYKKCLKDADFQTTPSSVTVSGNLTPGTYVVDGNVSSQYITGLLFALPLLKGDSVLNVIPPLESAPYVDMTLDVLKDFGIDIKKDGTTFYVKGNQNYTGRDSVVEGDYSNAAFLEAFNALNGAGVTVDGLKENSLQGDRVYKQYFSLLQKPNADLDISDCIDLGPVLFAYSSLFYGGTFTGTKRLFIKESDRAGAMKQELEKFGVSLDIQDNSVTINNKGLKRAAAPVLCHNDHRIAMSLSLLLTAFGGILSGAECVDKSYPNYFDDLRSLRIKTDEI